MSSSRSRAWPSESMTLTASRSACIKSSLFLPELVEEAGFFHLVQVARVDQLLRLHLLRPGVGLGDVLDHRRDRLRADRQPRLERLDLRVVRRVENLPVGHALLFA